MNLCMISGRLTRDIEMRKTTHDANVAKFSVAVGGTKDKDGNKHTDFFNCQAFGGTADMLEKYFHKGDPIELVGRMESNTSDGKTYWNFTVERWNFAQTAKAKDGGAHDAVVNGLREATAEESADLPF